MVYLQIDLSILFTSYMIINSNILRLYSICLIFFSQILLSSSSNFNDRGLIIAKSINDYACQTHVLTCYFRKCHHQLFDSKQQSDVCKSYLILHSCLHYDTDTIRVCEQSLLHRTKIKLDNQIPKHCFTSSVYKTFCAQHLRSIAPLTTIVNYQIFVLFFLLILFIIKKRTCC